MVLEFKPVNTAILRRIHDRVRWCRRSKHRPTVAMLVEHAKTNKFLLTESRNAPVGSTERNPGIVKGKVEKGEHVLAAVFRELEEEARYDGPQHLTINTDELSGFQWLTIERLREEVTVLLATRPDKHAVLNEAFCSLGKTRKKSSVRKASKKKKKKST